LKKIQHLGSRPGEARPVMAGMSKKPQRRRVRLSSRRRWLNRAGMRAREK
jgi:hypothetical protein